MTQLSLRSYTAARVALAASGHSLKTAGLMTLRVAHAEARDAVHTPLNGGEIQTALSPLFRECLSVRSAASNRKTYLLRPDLGRQLDAESREILRSRRCACDLIFVAADGLSALAVQQHSVPLIAAIMANLQEGEWTVGPVVIAQQARVALGDEIGYLAGAKQTVTLIGERPGSSAIDSLGAYLTWGPRPGLTDADRNCVSNIRSGGLTYRAAAHKILFLLTESRRRKLSGVHLNEDAGQLPELKPRNLLTDDKAS